MAAWPFGAVFALLGGLLIGWLCYRLARYILLKRAAAFSFLSFGRQLLQIGYLAALYYLSPLTPWAPLPLLAGGAAGLTAALIVSTRLLLRINRENTDKEA